MKTLVGLHVLIKEQWSNAAGCDRTTMVVAAQTKRNEEKEIYMKRERKAEKDEKMGMERL